MSTSTPETQAIFVDGMYFEVTPEPQVIANGSGGGLAGGGPAALAGQLEAIGNKIGEVCGTLHARALDAIQGVQPDEFEIEFGVSLTGEAGIPLVSKGSATCNFVVRAKWDLSAAQASGGAEQSGPIPPSGQQ